MNKKFFDNSERINENDEEPNIFVKALKIVFTTISFIVSSIWSYIKGYIAVLLATAIFGICISYFTSTYSQWVYSKVLFLKDQLGGNINLWNAISISGFWSYLTGTASNDKGNTGFP